MQGLGVVIVLFLIIGVVLGLVWCARRMMDILERRLNESAEFERRTLLLLEYLKNGNERLVRNDFKLMETLKAGDGERQVKVPLKTVLLAVDRMKQRDAFNYDTLEEEVVQEKKLTKLKKTEDKMHNGFVNSLIMEDDDGE